MDKMFVFKGYGDHREQHVLTHSFPTRRSSDLVAGDPAWLYRVVPHPVVLLGRAVGSLERLLNRQHLPRSRRILLGGLFTLAVVGGAGALGALLHALQIGRAHV